jgi:prevent-host-death family protein
MTVHAQPASYVKTHLNRVLDQVRDGQGPVLITQKGAAAAILQDPESYHRTQEALALLKLVAMADEDYRHGRVHRHEDVFAAARKRLTELRRKPA